MNVTIYGPNLNNQTKGQFHVHAAECADGKHYGPGRREGGEEGWTIEATTALDVSAAVYSDHLSDYGIEDATSPEAVELLDGWLSDFHFAPCVKGLS